MLRSSGACMVGADNSHDRDISLGEGVIERRIILVSGTLRTEKGDKLFGRDGHLVSNELYSARVVCLPRIVLIHQLRSVDGCERRATRFRRERLAWHATARRLGLSVIRQLAH